VYTLILPTLLLLTGNHYTTNVLDFYFLLRCTINGSLSPGLKYTFHVYFSLTIAFHSSILM